MRKLRLKYLHGQIEKVRIPSSWKDVKFSTYLRLLNEANDNELKRVSILTGISEENLLGMGGKAFVGIRDLVAFCFDNTPLQKSMFIPEDLKDYDVGEAPWGDLEKCKQALLKCSETSTDVLNAAPVIVKTLYKGYDITEQPVTKVFGIASFFLMVSIGFFNVTRDYPNTSQSQRSLMRELKNSISSALLRLVTPSRGVIHVPMTKSSGSQPGPST